MTLLLGIDFVTFHFKVSLFEPAGTRHGLGRVAVGKDSSSPGRSEVPGERPGPGQPQLDPFSP